MREKRGNLAEHATLFFLKFEIVYERLTSARGVRNLAMRSKDIKIAAVKLPRPLGGLGDDDDACFDDFQQKLSILE